MPTPELTSKRRKGRPEKSLAQEDDRYLIAYIQALIDRNQAAKRAGQDYRSANVIAENIVAIRYGRLLLTPENLAAYMIGDKYLVVPQGAEGSFKLRGDFRNLDGQERTPQWRDKNIFRSNADDILRRLREYKMGRGDDWLCAMTVLWQICIDGNIGKYGQAINGAEQLAEHIGEGEYFRQCMKPLWKTNVYRREAKLDPFVLNDGHIGFITGKRPFSTIHPRMVRIK